MDSDKETVEVYDNATGEHYTRDATAEEIMIYQQIKDAANNVKVRFPNDPE